MHRVEWVAILAAVGLLAAVFELVRRKQVMLRYALLWLSSGAALLTLALQRDWLERLAGALGIFYAPSALFLTLNLFLIVILVHVSTVITQLKNQTRRLAQEVAELKALARESEARAAAPNDSRRSA